MAEVVPSGWVPRARPLRKAVVCTGLAFGGSPVKHTTNAVPSGPDGGVTPGPAPGGKYSGVFGTAVPTLGVAGTTTAEQTAPAARPTSARALSPLERIARRQDPP